MTSIRETVLDMETALIGLFVVVTIWILVGSLYLDSEASKLFPQLTSGTVAVLLVLFFLWRFLPEEFRERLPEKEALTYGEEDPESGGFDETAVTLVFGFFGAYIIGVYLFGFLIATPLYVYGNLRFYGYQGPRRRLLITAAVLVTVSVAYQVFRIPLDQGLIYDLFA